MQSIVEFTQQFWTDLQSGQLPELGAWNYILLSILIVWQGPVATLLGGAAASAGLMRPSLVFLAGIIGNLTADIIWYSVGRSGSLERFFEKGRLGKHKGRFNIFQSAMDRHATKVLLLAKLSAGLAVPALVAAGISKLSWRKWFPVVFIGESIWTGVLVLIGFYATEVIKQVEQGLQLLMAGLIFLTLLMGAWFVPRWLRQSEALNVSAYEENKTPR
jgi:membrane protein DedA with SNARE-associated domain